MPDYTKGKIYMIESLEGGCRYYGSTIQSLSMRLTGHRTAIKCGKNVSSKHVLKYSDARIILIELYPCDSKMELDAKESEYIRHNECVNKVIPRRTPQEYRQSNKDIINQRAKEYYDKNRDIINQKATEKITCECGAVVSKQNISTHKKTIKHIRLFIQS